MKILRKFALKHVGKNDFKKLRKFSQKWSPGGPKLGRFSRRGVPFGEILLESFACDIPAGLQAFLVCYYSIPVHFRARYNPRLVANYLQPSEATS